MKVWYLIISFIILIFVLTLSSKAVLIDATNDMQILIDSVQKSLSNNDYKKAQEMFSKFTNKWRQCKSKWAILIEHQEIDKIDEQVYKIIEYIKLKNKDELIPEISVLKFYVNHVKDMTSLEIENIF